MNGKNYKNGLSHKIFCFFCHTTCLKNTEFILSWLKNKKLNFKICCLSRQISSERVLLAACGLALCCTLVCAYSSGSPHTSLGAFILLEICVGMYYPAIGSLRSQVVPEQYRANIINWFRVPMNLITCGGLLFLHRGVESSAETNKHMFLVCTAVLAGATYLAYCFCGRYKASNYQGGAPATVSTTLSEVEKPLLQSVDA